MHGLHCTRISFTILALFWFGQLAVAENLSPVDLFAAIDSGQVAVKFIPVSAEKANVLIANNTDRVLHIELPDAIAAVPVLAQFGQEFGQNGGQNGGGASQGVGGGFQAGNGMQQGQGLGQGLGNGGNFGQRQGGANGFGMGLMRIAPRKTRKLTARTVCLEYGKPDPHPRIAYRMIPIEQFTDDAKVTELCRRLGGGEVSQPAAQAAAWHLASGLTWLQLADINRIESRYLGKIKFFQPRDLETAKAFVEGLSPRPSDDYARAR